jgi:glyoxylase-like metal-dependent hydrolase (beta-lactamase superfamily II)
MLPAPANKVTEVFDNDTLEIAGLTIKALETPGHARHHHVFEIGDVAFTGDAAAARLSSWGLPDVPAPPPEFDLEAWETTIKRLLSRKYRRIYPTHFGAVDDVEPYLRRVKMLIREAAEFIQTQMLAGLSRDEIVIVYENRFAERARAAGLTEAAIRQYATANPLYMSVDGIMRYWQKRTPL